ncbi:MAG: FAD-binding oxidoreductase [Polyangiales bacterium]
MSDLEACLRAWRERVGDPHVVTDTIAPALRATFGHDRPVPAIVRPHTVDEVRDCVRAAARFGVALHAVSRGLNWGLGSRLPHRDDVAVLDLSRMNRVRALDDRMGFATVEPGVTFADLHAALTAQGASHFVAATGSSPRASVLGNLLDRGDGVGPNTDRASHACALEVVLGDGSLVRTGFARFGEGPLAPLHRWGVGPSLDGLFSQSPFGVVTAGTVWLTPLPRSVQSLRFSVDDDARLPGLIDALRTLRLEGTLRGSLALWRDARVLSALTHHPRAGAADVRALDDATLRAMCAARGIARWSGVAPMYAASEAQGRADRERAVEVLAPVVDAWRCEERVGEAVAGREMRTSRDPAMALFQGVPNEDSVRSTYWRKGPAPDADLDPERDGCGVIWAVPAVPMEGAAVLRAVTEAERVLRAWGFDPLLAMTAPTPRVAQLVPLIVYDRDDPAQDQRARACHADLTRAMRDQGLLPARAGVLDAIPPSADDSDAILTRLRDALDPASILSPGRYGLGQ